MDNKSIFHFTVEELIEILQQYPKKMPIVVNGYEGGYENVNTPVVQKIKHKPGSPYWDGEFQIDDNGTNALILQRNII
jgi:hypothetical protein